MSRVHSVGSFVVVLALGASVHAYGQDGPPPVNTTRSISAGADEDIITQGDVDTHLVGEREGHAVGSYMGVVPGAAGVPPRAAANRPARDENKGPVTITWPGFQMRPDGSSRVFIQSTAPLAPQASGTAGKYQVRLPGARIAAATNRLPLDTRYFNTPVTKVSLSIDHGGATLSLDLRGEVTPHVSSEPDKSGYFFTYIDLPAGSYLPKPAAPAEPAQAAAPAPSQPAQQQAAKAAAPSSSSKLRLTRSERPEADPTDKSQGAAVRGRLALPD